MKLLKLGKMVTDSVTETKGMLTHATINMNGEVLYVYQPTGLSKETKLPVERVFLEGSRITGESEEVDVPLHLLGQKGKDMASGYKGKVTSLIYHINGCLHVELKAKGVIKKTGATIAAVEFDIRRIEGEAFTPLNDEEMDISKKETPSPDPIIPRTQR